MFNKRLPNDLGQIRAALEAHQEELAGVVIESTYNWYWLVDGLMDTGYRVHLAHPSAIKKYEGLVNEAAILRMRPIWRSSCGSGCWRRVISIRARSVGRGTWRASACSWCAIAPPRFYRSRAS